MKETLGNVKLIVTDDITIGADTLLTRSVVKALHQT